MKIERTRLAAEEAGRLGDRQPESLDQNADGWLGRLWDAVAPAIGEALSDLRKHVVEEPWFGREITPREIALTHHGQAQPTTEALLGFKELMQAQAAMLPGDRPAPDQKSPEGPHDAGFDR